MTYLLTFTCYGAHPPGSVNNPMKNDAYLLDVVRREIALNAIQEVCKHRHWPLIAVHVRSNHVHIVVDGDQLPEPTMTTFKAYISRALNQIEPPCRRWTRHGSTRYLWSRKEIDNAARYVISKQGEQMAAYAAGW